VPIDAGARARRPRDSRQDAGATIGNVRADIRKGTGVGPIHRRIGMMLQS